LCATLGRVGQRARSHRLVGPLKNPPIPPTTPIGQPRMGRRHVQGRTETSDRMSLFDATQLGLERAIQGAAMRQTALTGNVANADLAKNGLEYESLVTVARARLDILKYAVGVQ